MTRANFDKSEVFLKNTTTVSKYVPKGQIKQKSRLASRRFSQNLRKKPQLSDHFLAKFSPIIHFLIIPCFERVTYLFIYHTILRTLFFCIPLQTKGQIKSEGIYEVIYFPNRRISVLKV